MSEQAQQRLEAQARQEVAAQQAAAAEQTKGFGAQIWAAIQGFFQFLMDVFSGLGGGDGDNRQQTDPEVSSQGQQSGGALLFNGIRATTAAARSWAENQREHTGGTVTHSSPVRGSAKVGDDRHMREKHPVHGGKRMHHGIDITPADGNEATPDILASADGVVLYSGWLRGYGRTVIVGHDDGTYSLYAHMSGKNMPVANTSVLQGQVIGEMGSTGGSTGIHLHYEQRKGKDSIVPLIEMSSMSRGAQLDGEQVHIAHNQTASPPRPNPSTGNASQQEEKTPTKPTAPAKPKPAGVPDKDEGKHFFAGIEVPKLNLAMPKEVDLAELGDKAQQLAFGAVRSIKAGVGIGQA